MVHLFNITFTNIIMSSLILSSLRFNFINKLVYGRPIGKTRQESEAKRNVSAFITPPDSQLDDRYPLKVPSLTPSCNIVICSVPFYHPFSHFTCFVEMWLPVHISISITFTSSYIHDQFLRAASFDLILSYIHTEIESSTIPWM